MTDDQTHVVPNDILDGLHVTLDEDWFEDLRQVGFVQGGKIGASRNGWRRV